MHGLMCSPRSARASGRGAPVQTAPRAPSAPVDDNERAAAQRLLRDAFRDGELHVDDFENALSQALEARTVGEIDRATQIVPAHYAAQRNAARTASQAAAAAAAARRAEVGAYLRVMALLMGIWLTIGVAAGSWYPWPLWPALGWGLPLLASGRHARRDYHLRHGTFRTDSG